MPSHGITRWVADTLMLVTAWGKPASVTFWTGRYRSIEILLSLQSALSTISLRTALAASHVFAMRRCQLLCFSTASPDDTLRCQSTWMWPGTAHFHVPKKCRLSNTRTWYCSPSDKFHSRSRILTETQKPLSDLGKYSYEMRFYSVSSVMELIKLWNLWRFKISVNALCSYHTTQYPFISQGNFITSEFVILPTNVSLAYRGSWSTTSFLFLVISH
jgi:hypothetical protein